MAQSTVDSTARRSKLAMSVDFGHHDTNDLQDPVSELAFAANGTMPWSNDGRMDASLFEFDLHS